MTKLEETIYVSSTLHDNEVITFGKSPEQELTDWENGIARIGGLWRHPSYTKAYLRGSRILLKEANNEGDLDQLALPIFYLQRHTVELFIKGLLSLLYEIVDMKVKLNSDSSARNLISKSARLRRTNSHALSELNIDLSEISQALEISGYPKELFDLVAKIEKIESDPTWSRYPNSNKSSLKTHLGLEVTLPIVEIQCSLEAILQQASFETDGGDSYEANIYWEWNGLMQRLEFDE